MAVKTIRYFPYIDSTHISLFLSCHYPLKFVYFGSLFPQVLHLVRDPRAVIRSRMVTFHELYSGNGKKTPVNVFYILPHAPARYKLRNRELESY